MELNDADVYNAKRWRWPRCLVIAPTIIVNFLLSTLAVTSLIVSSFLLRYKLGNP